MYTYTLKYIVLCCAMAAVFAQDDKTEATSPVVWILFTLLFVIVGAMGIAMFFIAYHFHQRFKKIENRFSRRGSVSSERYLKNSDSRRSSKRSISSTGRYENNPIRKRRSRSPRSSPQPDTQPQLQNNNSNHVVLPMDTIYRNLQESEQHPQITYTSGMGHYETLATYTTNGTVTEEERKHEEPEQEQKQQQQQQQEVRYATTVGHDPQKYKSDNTGDDNGDVPIIEASYITPLPDRTVTNRTSDIEYSDVAYPSPPTPSKKEHVKVNSVRKGKKPDSSEEYTDPMDNGMANMKRLKATSMTSKSQDSSPAEVDSKQRRASESMVHRKDFEEWPIKSHVTSTVVPAPPPHESDL